MLNTRAAQPFLKHPDRIMITAKNPNPKFGTPMYCEDPRLSIQHPGTTYAALSVAKNAPSSMSIDDMRNILAVAGAFCNLEAYSPPTTPAAKRAFGVFTDRVAKMTQEFGNLAVNVCSGR